jgi:hypothetical protein
MRKIFLQRYEFFFVSLQINYGKGRACPAPTKTKKWIFSKNV